MDMLFILAVGMVAGTIGGIVGFGSSILLMPVLVIVYGPLQAVPIMAIAAILANASRIAVWWREVDWRAAAAYAITGVPAAVGGARTLLILPPQWVETGLGVFFLAMIPLRRWLASHKLKLQLWHLAVIGAGVGYLTGIVATTGPLTAPIFLAHGLVKGAFIATEAAASLAVYVGKAVAFRSFGALPADAVARGLLVGASLMAGAIVAKRFVLKLDASQFRLLMDALMLLSGATLLWTTLR
ncbi:MAG: sulfite exporter TauE/SafE family protein [Casimicrobiaceae bacterium]